MVVCKNIMIIFRLGIMFPLNALDKPQTCGRVSDAVEPHLQSISAEWLPTSAVEVRMRGLFLIAILLPVLLTGCTAQDAAGVKIDLSQLNWQTAAIIALALLVNPGKIVGQLTEQLGKVPGLEKILRILGLIRTTDSTPGELSQAEVLESLVSIVNRMPDNPLRNEIAKLLPKAASVEADNAAK